MPILANAKKALRVAQRRTVINRRTKSRVKTAIDAVRQTPDATKLSIAYSTIDTAVKKNLFHRNKAARIKRQLNRLVKGS